MDSNSVISASADCAVVPAWHTVIVLVALLSLSLAGGRSGNLPFMGYGRPGAYIALMAFEWIIVAFIWFGVRHGGVSFRSLVGGSWSRPVLVVRDFVIAIGFLTVSQFILGAVGHFLKAVPNQAIRNLLPEGLSEISLFLVLSLTAGFCEEVIFRGYLQRQFTALTHGTAGGIVLQAVAFGTSHAYQGWKWMLVIVVFGSMFGLLAYWRGSLRPGMLAHFLQDTTSGLIARQVLR